MVLSAASFHPAECSLTRDEFLKAFFLMVRQHLPKASTKKSVFAFKVSIRIYDNYDHVTRDDDVIIDSWQLGSAGRGNNPGSYHCRRSPLGRAKHPRYVPYMRHAHSYQHGGTWGTE